MDFQKNMHNAHIFFHYFITFQRLFYVKCWKVVNIFLFENSFLRHINFYFNILIIVWKCQLWWYISYWMGLFLWAPLISAWPKLIKKKMRFSTRATVRSVILLFTRLTLMRIIKLNCNGKKIASFLTSCKSHNHPTSSRSALN